MRLEKAAIPGAEGIFRQIPAGRPLIVRADER
jgi:hypothetical protein